MYKNYNYERKPLILSEYGRHIQEMVDYLRTIEDRDERNRQAEAVIGIMGNLNPELRDIEEYTHKLWDHLFLMAEFQLDVDSPYPIPTKESVAPRPEMVPYPGERILLKHYGKNVERMIRKIESEEESPQREESIRSVVRYMRTKGYEFNQEHPNMEAIINDIERMSEHGMKVSIETIGDVNNNYKQVQTAHPRKEVKQQNRGQKGGRGGKAQPHRSNRQQRSKGK